jgi:hypothetical protein
MFSFSKFVFPILLLSFACQSPKSKKVEEIINTVVVNSGFDSAIFSVNFDFRDHHYSLKQKPSFYSFSRSIIQNEIEVKDVMTPNQPLKRYLDGVPIKISDSIRGAYSNSLNSVMYFFQLPKPLQDPSVIKVLMSSVEINGYSYWTIKVTFKEEGGGEDYQDEYRYWINQNNYEIDFLAYNYQSDGGGTRFRRAINKRKINGMFFQDYENYKPFQIFEQLDNLPKLFEQGNLELISLIENKNIIVIK